jgi:hypothetical protein
MENVTFYISRANISCTSKQVHAVFKQIFNLQNDDSIIVKYIQHVSFYTDEQYKSFTIYIQCVNLVEYYNSNIFSIVKLIQINQCMVISYGEHSHECWKVTQREHFKPTIMTLYEAKKNGYNVK